jgi:hypothetical protein
MRRELGERLYSSMRFACRALRRLPARMANNTKIGKNISSKIIAVMARLRHQPTPAPSIIQHSFDHSFQQNGVLTNFISDPSVREPDIAANVDFARSSISIVVVHALCRVTSIVQTALSALDSTSESPRSLLPLPALSTPLNKFPSLEQAAIREAGPI